DRAGALRVVAPLLAGDVGDGLHHAGGSLVSVTARAERLGVEPGEAVGGDSGHEFSLWSADIAEGRASTSTPPLRRAAKSLASASRAMSEMVECEAPSSAAKAISARAISYARAFCSFSRDSSLYRQWCCSPITPPGRRMCMNLAFGLPGS